MSSDTDFEEQEELSGSGRHWGTGVLTALAVGLVVFGVILLGERGSSPSSDTTAVPALPAAAGGEQAIDFALTLFDGTEFSLSRHLTEDGRPVFLNFWASWCPPCRAEMPDISEAAQAHPDVLFLGIAVSDEESAAIDYAAEVNVVYPLGFDTTGRIEAHYPSTGLPVTFLISPSGEIVRTWVGQMAPNLIESLVRELLDT